MPNPSPLHDPLAKLFFPNAPLVPQLRSAAERDQRDGDGWPGLLNAAADQIEAMEEYLKSRSPSATSEYPYIWWHDDQRNWWLSTDNGSKAIGSIGEVLQALKEAKGEC
jgi:hypothetical protein